MSSIIDECKQGLYYEKDLFKDIFIPERFSKRIVSHVVLNYLKNNNYYKPPLYLAIQGDPGEGKTTQALAACTRRGILVKYLSSSELSGELEAASKTRLEKIYDQAIRLRRANYIVCILLDDFHLGNSNISSTNGRTVNAELLVSYMMNLVETSHEVHIPIILTGNDFTATYGPLLRDGRTDVFHWQPNLDEKKAIIEHIFKGFIAEKDKKQISKFVENFCDYNIAFFSQLKNDWRRQVVDDVIREYDVFDYAILHEIGDKLDEKLRRINSKELYKLAMERKQARTDGGLQ